MANVPTAKDVARKVVADIIKIYARDKGPTSDLEDIVVKSLNAHVAAATEWRDISTAPKDGTRILLWCIDKNNYAHSRERIGWFFETEWVIDSQINDLNHAVPTHWMPLPNTTPNNQRK